MKITILGSCAGTEPMPGRHHSSFTIEHNDSLFWIDAGEGCTYTAHLSGIDLLSTRAIFISHPHIDHIEGLPHLISILEKLNSRADPTSNVLTGKTIDVYIPELEVWEAIMKMNKYTFPAYDNNNIEYKPTCYKDGIIFDEKGLKITALHNFHMGKPQKGEPWLSYSYRIEADGKCFVYSGDLGGPEDVDPLFDSCDLLFMEAGHFQVDKVCRYLKEAGKSFDQLGIIHNGREVLADAQGELQKGRDILGDKVFISEDGMVFDL